MKIKSLRDLRRFIKRHAMDAEVGPDQSGMSRYYVRGQRRGEEPFVKLCSSIEGAYDALLHNA